MLAPSKHACHNNHMQNRRVVVLNDNLACTNSELVRILQGVLAHMLAHGLKLSVSCVGSSGDTMCRCVSWKSKQKLQEYCRSPHHLDLEEQSLKR